MRALIKLLAMVAAPLLAVTAAPAVEVYRHVAPDGTVFFTGHPVPGAERVEIELNTGLELRSLVDVPRPEGGEDGNGTTGAPPDYRLAFTNLQDGDVVWNDARRLELRLAVEPGMRVAEGHRLVVYVDGERRAGPTTATEVIVEGVERGIHTVQGRIVDGDGEPLAATPRITFTHKQHSIPTGG